MIKEIKQLEALTGKKVILKEDASEELTQLFNELVPSSGKADTVEGEMVRAINRIWYRYLNDGDVWCYGYGKETAGPSVKWLKTQSPLKAEMTKIFNPNSLRGHTRRTKWGIEIIGEFGKGDFYLKMLEIAGELIVKYVKSKQGNYTPSTHESR